MNPMTARWIFCSGLCFLAACAVLPEPQIVDSAPAAATLPAPEKALAKAMRERAELSGLYGADHPAVISAAAAEASLRQTALAADPAHFRRNLIRALSDELADVRRERRMAERHGEQHPAMKRADTAVRSLTAAINAEVRSAT